MKKLYEAWQDEDESTVSFSEAKWIKEQRLQGQLSENAQLLHSVEAKTWEEAMAVHHVKK